MSGTPRDPEEEKIIKEIEFEGKLIKELELALKEADTRKKRLKEKLVIMRMKPIVIGS